MRIIRTQHRPCQLWKGHCDAKIIDYISFTTLLAWSIGVDHHAAKEELYYYMRTKDNETHTMLTEFMDHFYEKVCKDDELGSHRVI